MKTDEALRIVQRSPRCIALIVLALMRGPEGMDRMLAILDGDTDE